MGHNANYAHNMLLNDSDSDDYFEISVLLALEEERLEREGASMSHRGSVLGHRIIQCDHEQGRQRLFQDYFAESLVYPLNIFRRRFRISRSLFLHIKSNLEEKDEYFVQKRNAAGVLGLSSLQKMTAALRMLAYGVATDFTDEYVRIGESIAIESLKKFVEAIVDIYSKEYLRSPNSNDIARLLRVGESRGFPGMLGSIDSMHWKWKNCPSGWKCQYTGHSREPTIILEAVASYDLWIWHAFFGLPGSHNDINVLDHSFIFTKLAQGLAPSVNYSINGHDYTMRYYLADGIYPSWSTFVKTIRAPQGKKNSLFATTQESTRKDVECAFGVLQTRFAIVRGPARLWRKEVLDYIMKACIILHNMIIENERDANGAEDFDCEQVPESIPTTVSHEPTEEFSQFTTFIVAHEKLEIEKLILNSNWISLSTCGNDMARCRII